MLCTWWESRIEVAVPPLQLQSYRKMVYTGLELAVAEWWDEWLRNILAIQWWIQGAALGAYGPPSIIPKNDFLASCLGSGSQTSILTSYL